MTYTDTDTEFEKAIFAARLSGYTDRAMFTAIANANLDDLALVFGDDADLAVAKANKKLANMDNSAARRRAKGSAKTAENIEIFNSRVAAYLTAEGYATTAAIRSACFGEDTKPSKVVAILRAAIAAGLCESRATAKVTYYGMPGFELPSNIA